MMQADSNDTPTRKPEDSIPAFTASVPFRTHPCTRRNHLAICAGVPTEEMLRELHILNIYIRDLADLAAQEATDGEISATANALRYLTGIATAMSEAIMDGSDQGVAS